MDNFAIADQFALLSKLIDIHGNDSFRAKSYASTAFAIEKLQVPLASLDPQKISSIRGIGSSSAQKIAELLKTGKIASLDKLLGETPAGILEMLQIKGVGPKKIHVIWKEMGIESMGELLYACRENRLKLFKGFGEKTQQNIIESIEFYLKHKESHLYAQAAPVVPAVRSFMEKQFGKEHVIMTGGFMRQLEVIDYLEFAVASGAEDIIGSIQSSLGGIRKAEDKGDHIDFTPEEGIAIRVYPCSKDMLVAESVLRSSSPEFAAALEKAVGGKSSLRGLTSEEDVFRTAGLPFVPSPRREDISWIKETAPWPPIGLQDIRGLIHCHSNWSDGGNTLEELAEAAKERGMEYMVISDHSKSAFYAQGLSVERIMAQHEQIDELNRKLKPFKIFKSIECDILNDGSLDYEDRILAGFDLVIASVHSNLKMTKEKAMDRLLKAIENPYTTILGHMTGRLLLGRNGYPVDHDRIIAACAQNKVAIELNANPNRLDMDWRHIDEALQSGVYISINPDAHFTEGIADILFGVLQAQKTRLTPNRNLSSLGLEEFEKYLSARRKEKGI